MPAAGLVLTHARGSTRAYCRVAATPFWPRLGPSRTPGPKPGMILWKVPNARFPYVKTFTLPTNPPVIASSSSASSSSSSTGSATESSSTKVISASSSGSPRNSAIFLCTHRAASSRQRCRRGPPWPSRPAWRRARPARCRAPGSPRLPLSDLLLRLPLPAALVPAAAAVVAAVPIAVAVTVPPLPLPAKPVAGHSLLPLLAARSRWLSLLPPARPLP